MIKHSSPYNDTFSPKDNDGIKDVANSKGLSEDVSLVISKDSSPNIDTVPQKDDDVIKVIANNTSLREGVSLVIRKVSSPYNCAHSPKS